MVRHPALPRRSAAEPGRDASDLCVARADRIVLGSGCGRMNHRLLFVIACGVTLGCLVPTLTPGAVGCYDVETPAWSAHLRPNPSTLPRLVMLDSAFAAQYQGMGPAGAHRRGWPWNDSVTITWTNEHSDWLLLPGDTLAVPRDGPAFHRLANDSIVVRMSGAFGGFVALLASDGRNFQGFAFHRDEQTFRQYSMPIRFRRAPCPATWTYKSEGI